MFFFQLLFYFMNRTRNYFNCFVFVRYVVNLIRYFSLYYYLNLIYLIFLYKYRVALRFLCVDVIFV